MWNWFIDEYNILVVVLILKDICIVSCLYKFYFIREKQKFGIEPLGFMKLPMMSAMVILMMVIRTFEEKY